MADIFVSYKSEDRERARQVAEALQAEGLDVWWDPSLQAGDDYQDVIDRNLRESRVVVVLWSALSARSRWVRSEATIGDRYGALAPAMIEKCDLPTAFVLVQTADLSNWRGDRNDPAWRDFVADITTKRDARKAAQQPAATPEQNEVETVFWQTIKDSSEAADFQSYLKRYPNGHFTDLARTRLGVLSASGGQAQQAKPRPNWFVPALAGAALLLAGGAFWWSQQRAPAAIEAPEAAAQLIGRYHWEGIACGQGPEITADGDAYVVTMQGAPTYRHAVESTSGGTIRMRVTEPAEHSGELYEFQRTPQQLIVTTNGERNEWDVCP
jgi:hypothetical protein